MAEGNFKRETTQDDLFIRGILDNDYRVLERIYAEYLPDVTAFIKSRRGTAEDARDVFQEAIVVVFKKSSSPDFTLNTPFGGYLYAVCRYIWWRQLKKKYRSEEVTPDMPEGYDDRESLEALLLEAEKRKLFQEKLAALGAECRKVLRLFFAGSALKEIGQTMGYTEDYIKKKNKTCKEKLAALVKNDPRYRELREED